MKAADIADGHVVELATAWHRGGGPGVVARLVAEGIPEKLALHKVERLVDRGRLDFGVSLAYAWPTGPLCWRRSGRGDWCAEHDEPWRHEGERLPAGYPPRPGTVNHARGVRRRIEARRRGEVPPGFRVAYTFRPEFGRLVPDVSETSWPEGPWPRRALTEGPRVGLGPIVWVGEG